MRKANLYRYQLEMDSGVILREQRLTEREGWIVELEEDGQIGRGEVAPLVGFSRENMDETYLDLLPRLESWVKGSELDCNTPIPSVAYGLSMAHFELRGLLGEKGNYQAAPLCNGDPDDLIPALNNMVGEKVAKIKVGLYEPIRDGMLVSLFLESIPNLQLRLDANRAWTLEKANKFAKYVNPAVRPRIQYIEEPCKRPSDSITFAIGSGMAIGWDETLQQAVQQPDFSFEQLAGAKAMIIKPMLIGHIDRCIALIKQAESHGLLAVISSSLESSLGLTQLARFAQQFTPKMTPGLDTLQLFKQQLHSPWPNSTLPLLDLSSQTLVWQQQSH
jgi:O-succinylbenzoate synthase